MESFEGLVELEPRISLALDVVDGRGEVVQQFASSALKDEAVVSAFVPKAKDEGSADGVFVVGEEFFGCSFAWVQCVQTMAGVTLYGVGAHDEKNPFQELAGGVSGVGLWQVGADAVVELEDVEHGRDFGVVASGRDANAGDQCGRDARVTALEGEHSGQGERFDAGLAAELVGDADP